MPTVTRIVKQFQQEWTRQLDRKLSAERALTSPINGDGA